MAVGQAVGLGGAAEARSVPSPLEETQGVGVMEGDGGRGQCWGPVGALCLLPSLAPCPEWAWPWGRALIGRQPFVMGMGVSWGKP